MTSRIWIWIFLDVLLCSNCAGCHITVLLAKCQLQYSTINRSRAVMTKVETSARKEKLLSIIRWLQVNRQAKTAIKEKLHQMNYNGIDRGIHETARRNWFHHYSILFHLFLLEFY
ncbi:hypothetical protein T4A_4645 [Trichinella pseudospiralis]|uniref:Secreted protein n=1 Tax=Trichinella pseudospiralis TaxID=6337 RepID=A0A0V1E8B1_TRIPS|nr:hypothetical protein T4A_4645 [Trichinella pseudospiralis]